MRIAINQADACRQDISVHADAFGKETVGRGNGLCVILTCNERRGLAIVDLLRTHDRNAGRSGTRAYQEVRPGNWKPIGKPAEAPTQAPVETKESTEIHLTETPEDGSLCVTEAETAVVTTGTEGEMSVTKKKDPSELKRKAPKAPREPKTPKVAKERKLSGLDAAARILAQSNGKVLTCPEICLRAKEQGLWAPAGLTPAATLHAAISREIKARGAESRFAKEGRGLFGLAGK